MTSLAEIRARIQAQDNKQTKNSPSGPTDNAIFPHWNAEEGSTVSVRFLPDGDSKNTFFWAERQLIRLSFNGVKNNPSFKQVVVQVPCMEMWGENCPILTEVRPWYKDETLKEMANKYWKKRSYIYQGFVRQNPLEEEKVPENPIRKFIISPQIFAIIRSSIMDPEMEDLPTDYVNGLDFHIKKSSKGGYADYSTSNWARKTSSLTETEQDAIEKYGLFNLSDFLPKKPTEAELTIIKEMFDASVEGRPYDNDRWGQYYRPYGLDAPNGSVTKTIVPKDTPKTHESVNKKDNDDEDEVGETSSTIINSPPWEEEPAASPIQVPKSSDKAQDILKMIRAKRNTPSV